MENKNKKKWIIWGSVILIVTNLATFFLSNSVNFAFGNKVLLNTDSQETSEGLNKLLTLKKNIETDYYKDVNDTSLMEGAIKGMFDSLGDPYSVYYTPEEFESYVEAATGVYDGVGFVVSEDEAGGTYVVSTYKGMPADTAGIQPGDKIVKVDGEDVETSGSDEVVKRIKGPAKTSVNLTLSRGEEALEFAVTREAISAETVASKTFGDLGYIEISGFSNKTADDFVNQLNELLSKNITGLVIDLRSNPGGSVPVAVAIGDRLLGETNIVYSVDKNEERIEYNSSDELKVDLPMVVLVNGGTASSSEMLAGALQDTKAGVLVGEKTFGKGIIQEVFGLKDGGGYKVTNSEYFTPNGRSIHEKGLEPDILIPTSEVMMTTEFTEEEDVQLQKALEILNTKE